VRAGEGAENFALVIFVHKTAFRIADLVLRPPKYALALRFFHALLDATIHPTIAFSTFRQLSKAFCLAFLFIFWRSSRASMVASNVVVN
jgi:hypothetical protein